MSKIIWDKAGERYYETGVKNGVLYPMSNGSYPLGVAWNGLTAVTESPSGAEATPLYADDIKYLNLISNEDFGATVEAYTYPDEFAQCDGSAQIASGVSIGQQTRKTFGLCYKTVLGNDEDGTDHGYKLHIIYNAKAAPSEKAYATVNDSPEAITLSWSLTTTPVSVSGCKPTAILTIDSTKVDATKLAQLEDILYGTSATNPRLPLPDEIAALMGQTVKYAVDNYLTNVETSNDDTTANGTYSCILSAKSGFTMENVIVMMGGVDVTDTVYTSSTGAVSISSLNGNIVIFATANATAAG